MNQLYIRNTDFFAADISNEEKALFDSKSGAYFVLNEIGTMLWNILDKPLTQDRMIEAIFQEYDVDKTQLIQDVQKFLNELLEDNIINIAHD